MELSREWLTNIYSKANFVHTLYWKVLELLKKAYQQKLINERNIKFSEIKITQIAEKSFTKPAGEFRLLKGAYDARRLSDSPQQNYMLLRPEAWTIPVVYKTIGSQISDHASCID